METLNLETLKKAVAGDYAAIRRVTSLEPQGDKVFPPTYEGGEYADEKRQVRAADGTVQAVDTVLLDSVQSQANRMELALLRAYDDKKLKMPMLQVDFVGDGTDPILTEIGRITALEAPHRMCDAIFRDALCNGHPFRGVEPGSKLNGAKSANATAVFELCPTALLFGFWDSTGPRGGLGTKVQRALVSEIVGYQKADGKRTSSRIDPLQIENNVDIYETEAGGWTFEEAKARKDKNGQPVKLKPSEINHGNITPSFRHEDKNTRKQVLNHGGVTLAYAMQYTVLSLAALRRLKFPLGGVTKPEVDNAARTVLAALGLAAICFLDEDGYDLRSRCLLDGKPGKIQFVGRGETRDFCLDAHGAAELVAQAAGEAKGLNLPWPEAPVTLQPSPDLSRLVVESRKRSMATNTGA
ncbi:MAG: type I-U CRISPR-associated RAMP protein Csb1/Cas7u [Bryobacteraceae bacterium]|jgi:CRISPR-associated protein Csb1